jgi:hypothetical protein
VNIHAFRRSMAVAVALLAAPALAEQFGPVEVSGFLKEEFSSCDNCSRGLVNPSPYDPRGVLPGTPAVNQGGASGHGTSNLGLAMLTLGISHEFDNAVKIEGKASARERNNAADIFDHYLIDLYAGVSHPKYGSLQVGDLSTRSWTRSDSFAYPLGLSSPWAETGAGYGVIPTAIRYATREFEIPIGKIRFEATYGTTKRRGPLNPSSATEPAPNPHLFEAFVQYSNEKNLVELIHQSSSGGVQSSFAKGAFYGAQGNTNPPSTLAPYQAPSEDLQILQGTHWFNPTWKLTYGLKRSEWSGQQQQCDFGPVSPVKSDCFWDQGGFNYWRDNGVHHAIEWDTFLGGAYTRGLYAVTLGGVRLNKAYVHTPAATEWGQNNTATFLNLGLYRKVPELYRSLEVYGGLGRVIFGRQGPAPLSMPANTADGNVDPRTSRSANSVTIGANLLF